MFLNLKPKRRWFNDILFTTTIVGQNELCFIDNKLTTTFLNLKDEISSNKIGRCVKITHTIKTFIPTKYDMEVASYYDFKVHNQSWGNTKKKWGKNKLTK
jgi:hypothetical protein